MVIRVCVAAALLAVVVGVPMTRLRRSYSDIGYLPYSVEDASIAGDGIIDCSDDSSESIELAYIINKREVPEDRPTLGNTGIPVVSTIAPASATATNYPK